LTLKDLDVRQALVLSAYPELTAKLTRDDAEAQARQAAP
jgi:hypothetical protein